MTGRAVWKRASATGATSDEGERRRCGGPEMSVEERYQMMRERRLARKKEQEPAQTTEPPGKDDEEDELKAAERFRNDRYAVKLLKQDDDAWGGRTGGEGVLG